MKQTNTVYFQQKNLFAPNAMVAVFNIDTLIGKLNA